MVLTEAVFLDANIPMYAVGREHPYRGPFLRVLQRVLEGHLEAVTNTEVHQEILYRYLSLGMGEQARDVSERFQTLVPRVLPVTMPDIVRARDLSAQYPSLQVRDLLHVAVMLNNSIATIISVDRDFDQVTEIRRLDPLHME